MDRTVPNSKFIPFLFFIPLIGFGQPGSMEGSLLKQRDSIHKQIESIRKTYPVAFNITRLPAEEMARQPICGPVEPIEPVISLASSKAGVSPDLVRAVILQESAFDPCAVSPKGALGLMQLMPQTARQLGVSNPFDPKQNVEAGATLLRQLIDRYGGDLSLALSAYNAGPARVDRTGKVPDILETTNYVRNILSALPMQ